MIINNFVVLMLLLKERINPFVLSKDDVALPREGSKAHYQSYSTKGDFPGKDLTRIPSRPKKS